MKNHFITAYVGNKREEVYIIYENIQKYIEDKKIIIEPFCGSSSISYYISLQHPKKYQYILNDCDKFLIELYHIMKDEEKLKKFIEDVNKLCFVENEFINKETYDNIIKTDDIYGWFISRKFYNIRQGLYPLRRSKKLDFEKINETPIINFLRTEDIFFKNIDGVDIYEEYKNNDEVFMIMDPPYIQSCNDFYESEKKTRLNIYEHVYNNHVLNKKNICFILEKIWIINLLFRKYKKIDYDKTYNSAKKKKTKHIICIND
jgi:hypothetical protein